MFIKHSLRRGVSGDLDLTVLSVLMDHQNIAQFRGGITHPIDIGLIIW